jgi:hypothetical protein
MYVICRGRCVCMRVVTRGGLAKGWEAPFQRFPETASSINRRKPCRAYNIMTCVRLIGIREVIKV